MTHVQYQFNFDRYREHLVDVHISWQANADMPTLWLPSWLAGSYLMREFARHITLVTYETSFDKCAGADDNAQKINAPKPHRNRAIKLSKNQWQLPKVTQGQWVQVHYEVYCYDLSVRTAYVDQYRLFGNFSSLALAVTGLEKLPCQVRLQVPNGFIQGLSKGIDKQVTDKMTVVTQQSQPLLACGLSARVSQSADYQSHELVADSYDELIDYPFEFALQTSTQFMVDIKGQDATQGRQIAHHVCISGRHHGDMSRLGQDLQQICQGYVNWLGDTPFDDYHFLTYASGDEYGGLEHGNSTALITSRTDLPSFDEPNEPSGDYRRFLGLCSHEYFHAWWVKTVRPDVMMAVDLTQEAYTPLLWVFEGFTSYVDDFMLQASGVISTDSYLDLLTEQINRYQQTDGRAWQSVAESSFDAWIKLYRSDENTANAGISYYNKGALVALCLDILLLMHSQGKSRLFDVIKQFYQLAKREPTGRIGMSMDSLAQVMGDYLPSSVWQAFVEDYVNGVKPLPLKSMLASVGVDMVGLHSLDANKHSYRNPQKVKCLPWGIHTQSTPAGLLVQKVKRGSVASQAGLSAKDVIVAIDGIKASSEQLARAVKEQSLGGRRDIVYHAFRRDELMCVNVPARTDAGVPANHALDEVRLRYSSVSDDTQNTPNTGDNATSNTTIRPIQTWLKPKLG